MRRSLLFIPGNQPNMIQNGLVLPADALIFDLEDSVAAADKDAARDLVASALRSLDFGPRERLVRINDLASPLAREDLEAVVAAGADAIMLPKVAGPESIRALDALLTALEANFSRPAGTTLILALIETALGIEEAYRSATASPRLVALALGAEDLAADLGCQRTREGLEILYSRSRLVMAAKAAGIEAIDTPFTQAHDQEACLADSRLAASLGFTGKLCISPHHLDMIHQAYTPDREALAQALEIQAAMEEATRTGKGAVSLRGRMIDPPVLKQAQRVIDLARAAGIQEGGSCESR